MAPESSLFDRSLPVAMAGLRAATARITDLGETEPAARDHTLIEQALVETLWWQKSVEDLWEEELGEAFYRKRDSSSGGLTVGGLAYARNVGGHRVDRAYDEVVYRAASTVESVTIASFGPRALEADDGELKWPPLADLPELPMTDPFGRTEMYSTQVADRPLLEPLHAALGFFEELNAG